MMTKLKALALAGTILAAPLFANAASAASIIGLVDGKTLVWIDPATKKVTGEADIKGAAQRRRHRRPPGGRHALRGHRRRRHLHGRRQERPGHDEEQAVRAVEGRRRP